MSQQVQAKLHYRTTNERVEGDYIVADSMPYATWTCQCGKEVTSYNLVNDIFYTVCSCGLLYSVDWRHGLTPRVLLLSEE